VPQNVISIPWVRNTGISSASTGPTAVAQVLLLAASDGGMMVGPVFLPPWVDLTRPMDLAIQATSLGATTPSGNVLWHLDYAWAQPGSAWNQTGFSMLWPVPVDFFGGATEMIPLLDVSGFTVPAGEVGSYAALAFHITRLGTDGSDDYNRSILLATAASLTAYVRCQRNCCC
jgi:hypothetical protein